MPNYSHGTNAALRLGHWPGNRKIPGSMPSFLEQGTLLSLLQSTQLYKWVHLSHQYCKDLGDLSRRSSAGIWRDLFGEVTVKNVQAFKVAA